MELLGTFETIAQIAITLTGFTGIAVALGRRGLGDWNPIESFLLRALLYWSIGTMFLAFVPSGISSVPAVTAPWRVSHGLFALFHTGAFVWFFREIFRLGALHGGAIDRLNIFVGLIVLLAELLVVSGRLADLAPLLYLIALLWFLFLAIRVFVGLLFPLPAQAR